MKKCEISRILLLAKKNCKSTRVEPLRDERQKYELSGQEHYQGKEVAI
jgi:hypothetical protein